MKAREDDTALFGSKANLPRLFASFLLVVTGAAFFLESYWCGLQSSKWVGLEWTASMKSTERRGELAFDVFLVLQLVVALVLPTQRALGHSKLENHLLFASLMRTAGAQERWRRWLRYPLRFLLCTNRPIIYDPCLSRRASRYLRNDFIGYRSISVLQKNKRVLIEHHKIPA